MHRTRKPWRAAAAIIGVVVFAVAANGTAPPSPRAVANAVAPQTLADTIRDLERQRLHALVLADTVAAGRLLAPDFELIPPTGATVSRQQYLGGLASGLLHYAAWDPDSIRVRAYNDAAVVRYRAHLVMVKRTPAGPDTAKPFSYWHTDLYERRPTGWQAVWSQATAIGR